MDPLIFLREIPRMMQKSIESLSCSATVNSISLSHSIKEELLTFWSIRNFSRTDMNGITDWNNTRANWGVIDGDNNIIRAAAAEFSYWSGIALLNIVINKG